MNTTTTSSSPRLNSERKLAPSDVFKLKEAYRDLWLSHKERVINLQQMLLLTFPCLKNDIKFGYGAGTDQEISYSHESGVSDIILYRHYEPFCELEVTGSSRVLVPPNNFWVRPDKVDHALKKAKSGVTYWLWLNYPGTVYLLDGPNLERFKNVILAKVRNGISEEYCEIPWTKGLSPVTFFKWLNEELK